MRLPLLSHGLCRMSVLSNLTLPPSTLQLVMRSCKNCRVIILNNFIVLDSAYFGPEIASNSHFIPLKRLKGIFPGSLEPVLVESEDDNTLIFTTIRREGSMTGSLSSKIGLQSSRLVTDGFVRYLIYVLVSFFILSQCLYTRYLHLSTLHTIPASLDSAHDTCRSASAHCPDSARVSSQ